MIGGVYEKRANSPSIQSLVQDWCSGDSHGKGEAKIFLVAGIVRGISKVLLMMKEGAKWKLFIPPELAYGDKRAGGIEPNSTLIFDVELISVQKN